MRKLAIMVVVVLFGALFLPGDLGAQNQVQNQVVQGSTSGIFEKPVLESQGVVTVYRKCRTSMC